MISNPINYTMGDFSPVENDYLLRNYETLSIKDLAKNLNRKYDSVRHRLIFLTLHDATPTPSKALTQKEIVFKSKGAKYSNGGYSLVLQFCNSLFENEQTNTLPSISLLGRNEFIFQYKKYKKLIINERP